MLKYGFDEEYINKVIDYIIIIDKKENLDSDETPIEVKIVSSADWLSHMIWPFYLLWMYENPDKVISDLLEWNIKKLQKDRDKKIVLPWLKKLFKERYQFLLQTLGNFNMKSLNLLQET